MDSDASAVEAPTDLSITAKATAEKETTEKAATTTEAGYIPNSLPEKQLCSFCTTKCCSCSCPQLEAEPLRDNEQLLAFQVRSRDVDWKRFVRPLDTGVRGDAVYLDKQSDFVSNHRRSAHGAGRRELLVCHDMMGNYLADRHFQGSEKYDDYRFMHWSAVDYFCYFSHQYVTIPPSGWLNAAHRHGVSVLGTYIVEGNTGSRLLHEVLASTESVQRTVDSLTRLCRHFSFEGWLVNVECPVRAECMPNLYRFVELLRRTTEQQVAHGRVFWYDSVIDNGELSWQNELNERNVQFFRASHGTLINYMWNDSSLEANKAIIRREQAEPHRVFLGLDVFGRGQVGRFQSAETLARIASCGFSAGIFAPAWCYETLQQFGYDIRKTDGDESVNAAFLARNETWWARLWEFLGTHPYRSLPFYTNFCVGSGSGSYECGAREAVTRPFFNLALQALQPSVPLGVNADHSFDTAYAGGCALHIVNYERAFRLFLTEFQLPLGVLLLGYAYKFDAADADDLHTLDVVLRCSPARRPDQDLYIFCGNYGDNILKPGNCYISPLGGALPPRLAHDQLPTEPGVLGDQWRVRYYMVKFDGPVQLLDIGLKCLRPHRSRETAHFGAIYVQSLQLKDWRAVQSPDKANIAAYNAHLWSDHSTASKAEARQ